MPGNRVEHVDAVGNVPGDRAYLVERTREGYKSIARYEPVGRLQSNDAAERSGLPYAAAGVGAERVEAFARSDRSRRASAAASGHAVEVPRIVRGEERRILGGRPHRELV